MAKTPKIKNKLVRGHDFQTPARHDVTQGGQFLGFLLRKKPALFSPEPYRWEAYVGGAVDSDLNGRFVGFFEDAPAGVSDGAFAIAEATQDAKPNYELPNRPGGHLQTKADPNELLLTNPVDVNGRPLMVRTINPWGHGGGGRGSLVEIRFADGDDPANIRALSVAQAIAIRDALAEGIKYVCSRGSD